MTLFEFFLILENEKSSIRLENFCHFRNVVSEVINEARMKENGECVLPSLCKRLNLDFIQFKKMHFYEIKLKLWLLFENDIVKDVEEFW